MSEQDGTQSPVKQHRSRKVNTTDQENSKQAPAAQPPTNDDKEAWKVYWKARSRPWRTEPEISPQRQNELEQRRSVVPNIDKGIYPFREMKLSRADIEWLLATHKYGEGPVYGNDVHELKHEGLDIRGADLCQVNLRDLPLACIRGGLTRVEWYGVAKENRKMAEKCAAVLMEGTHIERAHLEGADLRAAQFQGANFRQAHLEGADLSWSQLKNANLRGAYLEGADLYGVNLEGADLNGAKMEKAQLDRITLADDKHIGPQLADVQWDGANLAVVNWSQVSMLGDEYEARQRKRDGVLKISATRDAQYRRAVRANRQLAVALQTQGLNEDAARFAYRAQKLQCIVLRRQQKLIQYLFSLFLDLLAGYGYRPGRSVIWYLIIIFGFALSYHVFGGLSLIPPDAFVFSIMSFHGRGFFPSLSSETNLHNPLVMLAAAEAIVGLLIEISFIATFTQRFFGK